MSAAVQSPLAFAARGIAPIPHTYFTVLPTKTGGFSTQFGLIGFIMAQTFGAPRAPRTPAPEWSKPITLGQFAQVAQVTERACADALEDATTRGLIRRKKLERGYIYQAAPDNWPGPPDRTYLPKKPMGKEGEETAKNTGSALLVSLAPRHKKPSVFKVEAETKVSCVNESTGAHLTIEDAENGSLTVRVSDVAAVSNDTGSPLQVSNGHVNGSKGSGVSIARLHELLDDYFRRRHGKLPDNPLLTRISKALASATFEHYRRLVHDRWRKGDVVGAGVLLAIAEEAGRAAVAHKQTQIANETRRAEESQKLSLDSLLDALRMGEDPLAKEIIEGADPALLREARRLL